MAERSKAAKQQFFLPNEDATTNFASLFASLLGAGDCVLLQGPLGAGKTSFARALVRTLSDDPELDVPSPTFLLVLPYEIKTGTCLHVDLYRLEEAEEIDELGLQDDPDAITLIEWPERDPSLWDRAQWLVQLTPRKQGQGREISISALDDSARLAKLDNAFAGFERI